MGKGSERLPFLPLREGILFPGAGERFLVGRENSVQAIAAALKDDRRIVCAVQKNPEQENPGDNDFLPFGTIAFVESIENSSAEARLVSLEGITAGRLDRLDAKRGEAWISPLEDMEDLNTRAIRHFLACIVGSGLINHDMAAEYIEPLLRRDEAGQALQRIVAEAGIAPQVACSLLGEPSQSARLKALESIFEELRHSGSLREQLDNRAKQRIHDAQRKFVLREILRDVKGELGLIEEGKADDFDEQEELAQQLKNVALSPEARKRSERELKRLENIPAMSPEYSVLHTYLEWLRDLPWGIRAKEEGNIAKVRRALEKSHYGLDEVKRGIIEYVASRQLAGEKGRGSILCLVGPPGTGKTSLAKAIADALGRKFVRMSLGGMRDEAEIRGHRRTYVGAMPGRILQHLRKAGSVNPVFLLDEVDKLGSDYRGDPSAALLEVLDPETNSTFQDLYLEVEFDLSQVFFITTANSVHGIPPALADRMEVIQIAGYTAPEKRSIAERFLLPRQMESAGVPKTAFTLGEDALERLIHEYTREAGVRSLEREIQRICRKQALRLLEGKNAERKAIRAQDLTEMLGKPRYANTDVLAIDRAGLVHGLAWTESGGQVLDIEARAMPGEGRLVLTGKLGSVMQESAQTACSLARCMVVQWVDFDCTKWDIHIHAPEAAIPKDGPSAGITIASAVISALTGKKAVSDMALTGELTLLGKVLPIGGLKEKVLAAKRLGVKTIILPQGNLPDLEELDAKIKRGIYFRTVRDMDEVLWHIIPGLASRDGQPAGKKRPAKRRAAANTDFKTTIPPIQAGKIHFHND